MLPARAEYWADPSKPSVIKGEWHTDAKEGENYDSPILKGLSQQGFYGEQQHREHHGR